ncbi:MAG: hypothetical protein HN344_09370 [Gammaproteobacteria bacterium]|nr:hypothetical protein [Gammaproteobacteria bacterium]
MSQPALADNGWGNSAGWGPNGSMMNPGMGRQQRGGNPMMNGMNPMSQMMGSKMGRLDKMERLLISIDASLRKLVELESRQAVQRTR